MQGPFSCAFRLWIPKRCKNGAKECIVWISARPFQWVFTCNIWLLNLLACLLASIPLLERALQSLPALRVQLIFLTVLGDVATKPWRAPLTRFALCLRLISCLQCTPHSCHWVLTTSAPVADGSALSCCAVCLADGPQGSSFLLSLFSVSYISPLAERCALRGQQSWLFSRV